VGEEKGRGLKPAKKRRKSPQRGKSIWRGRKRQNSQKEKKY